MYDKEKITKLISIGDEKSAIDTLNAYCKKFPKDLNAKFDLALLYTNSLVYLDGHEVALDLLNEIKKDNNLVHKKLILKSFIENVEFGEINRSTLNEIEKFMLKENFESAELYYIKSKFYKNNDDKKSLLNVKKCLELDNSFFNIYLVLDEVTNNNHAISNIHLITKIFSKKEIEQYNPLDFTSFVNEEIKGIWMTKEKMEIIKDDYEKDSKD